MYWDNISPAVLQGQRAVFDVLGIPLVQERANRVPHGEWMDAVAQRLGADDIVVFADIDAFPLTSAAFHQAIEVAAAGGLFGLAQFSNHKPTQSLYAGPMFMAFSKALWVKLGCPSLKRDKQCDAAEAMTLRAQSAGVPLTLMKPTACLHPKWALKNEGVFGIGTFYGDLEFFHLFESRLPAYEQLFGLVVDDVVAQRPFQFSRYLEVIFQAGNEIGGEKLKSSWWARVCRKFGV